MNKEFFIMVFSRFLTKHQLKVELLCVAIYFIGFFLVKQNIDGGSAMTGFSFPTLASIYYLSAFVQICGSSFLTIVANKTIGLSAAVAIVGILFFSLNLSGGKILLGVGTTSLALAVLLLAISEFISEQGVQSSGQLIRSALILCYSVYIYLNPPL